MRLFARSLCLLCCTTLACGERAAIVQHPILDKSATAPAISDERRELPAVRLLQERMRHARRTTEIGTFDGPPGTILGRPTDVVVMPSGELLVLDAAASEIRAFDQVDGRYLRTLATKGQGPSEVVNPIGIELLAGGNTTDHRLVLGTRTHVKIFNLESDRIELTETIGPPDIPLPTDVCVSRAHIVLRAGLPERLGLIAVVDKSRQTRGFGEGYRHGGPMARIDLSAGPAVCLPNGDVVVGFTYLPTIRAYDASGRVKWESSLPNFTPLVFEERHQSGQSSRFVHRFDSAGDMLQALQYVPGGGVVAQVIRLGPPVPGKRATQLIERRSTYLLAASSGEGVLVSTELPQLLAATDTALWVVDEASAGHLVIAAYRY